MDPMTVLSALRFLRSKDGKKLVAGFGDKLGPFKDLLGGGADDPALTVNAAIALLAELAPRDETTLTAYVEGIAQAVRGYATVRQTAVQAAS